MAREIGMDQQRHDAMRRTVIDLVGPGIKGVELACEMAAAHRCDGEEILALLDRMVASGEVVEVVYVRPEDREGDAARAKSFFLPGGTVARIAPAALAA